MLYLRDWRPELHFKPSRILAKVFLSIGVLMVSACLGFCIWMSVNKETGLNSTSSLIYLATFFLFSKVYLLSYRELVNLTHPRSLIALKFDSVRSTWTLLKNNGACEENLCIKSYFLSAYLIVIDFQPLDSNIHSRVVLKRCLIFSDQLSETEYRALCACLKFGRKDLLSLDLSDIT